MSVKRSQNICKCDPLDRDPSSSWVSGNFTGAYRASTLWSASLFRCQASLCQRASTWNGLCDGRRLVRRSLSPLSPRSQQDVLKLGDFGSCRSVYSRQPYTEYISTRWYRAPECLLTDGFYGFKMDLWSAGCVLYEMAR